MLLVLLFNRFVSAYQNTKEPTKQIQSSTTNLVNVISTKIRVAMSGKHFKHTIANLKFAPGTA